jgi:hypothetical protein
LAGVRAGVDALAILAFLTGIAFSVACAAIVDITCCVEADGACSIAGGIAAQTLVDAFSVFACSGEHIGVLFGIADIAATSAVLFII